MVRKKYGQTFGRKSYPCHRQQLRFVTGGSSGIGRATALTFAREGAKVVIADVGTAGGEETVQLIKTAGGEAVFVKTDVTQASQVQATIDTYGQLECAFNKAEIPHMLKRRWRLRRPIGKPTADSRAQ